MSHQGVEGTGPKGTVEERPFAGKKKKKTENPGAAFWGGVREAKVQQMELELFHGKDSFP